MLVNPRNDIKNDSVRFWSKVKSEKRFCDLQEFNICTSKSVRFLSKVKSEK